MIPPLDPTTGLLPTGIHAATWDELVSRFGHNAHRRALLAGLRRALTVLRAAGCGSVYIDGSLVTAKALPADFDACWEIDGVNFPYLAAHAPMLLHPTRMAAEQKAVFGGELFPARVTANRSGTPFLDYFQYDSRTAQHKGIVALNLESPQ